MLSFGFRFLFKGNKNIIVIVIASMLISMSMFFSVYFFIKDKYKKNIFYGMFSKDINLNFIYTIIPIIIGTMMLNMLFNYLIPTSNDSTYNQFMIKVASNKSYITLFMIPIAIVAPITEELIFRGFLLRGIASNHKPIIAITVSAFLFSAIHFNMAQIPNAFVLGVIFAFIMIHSRNIFYTIIYHAINNFFVTFMLYFVNPDELKKHDSVPVEVISPVFLIVMTISGIILIYIGLKWTIKTITGKERELFPEKNVYDDYLAGFEKRD